MKYTIVSAFAFIILLSVSNASPSIQTFDVSIAAVSAKSAHAALLTTCGSEPMHDTSCGSIAWAFTTPATLTFAGENARDFAQRFVANLANVVR